MRTVITEYINATICPTTPKNIQIFKNLKVMKVLQNQKNISWQLILNFLQFLQLDLKV